MRTDPVSSGPMATGVGIVNYDDLIRVRLFLYDFVRPLLFCLSIGLSTILQSSIPESRLTSRSHPAGDAITVSESRRSFTKVPFEPGIYDRTNVM